MTTATLTKAAPMIVPRFCTCGEPEPHRIRERRTADGIGVVLWSDGAVLGVFGSKLKGVPMRRPRTVEAAQHARRVGWLFLGAVELYEYADLGDLYAAADRASRLDGLPGTVGRIFAERRARALAPKLAWQVTTTDRDGRPTERIARLPRLRWPGLYVIDFCGGPGSARGRYQLFEMQRGAVVGDRSREAPMSTGFAFRRLADLGAPRDRVHPRDRGHRDAGEGEEHVTTNSDKAGRWLRYDDGIGTTWMTGPRVSAKLAVFYGEAALDAYRLATEDEIHATIEAQRADPATWVVDGCPCGKFAAFDREREKATGSTNESP